MASSLIECTARRRAAFDDCRPGLSAGFWDAVILTAADEDQAKAFRSQIQAKVDAQHIPPCRYTVIADPPGTKIGNGGATMHALDHFEQSCTEAELDQWKILLIHAGGYSKRLPNVSVVGKIFAALPHGQPVFQMLEEKMAMYLPCLERMQPGVFVTCADDIEVYDPSGELIFDRPGITALGHPSSLEIGTTHGVFVLNDESRQKAEAAMQNPATLSRCTMASCRSFLHKPSVEVMRSAAAPVGGKQDVVFTDSAYFCDRQTCRKLIDFYRRERPLKCEIDAYGDFLQALGPEASEAYCFNSANVVSVEDSLSATRLKLFHHLRGTPLNVVLCHNSKFYHIGTLPEYLHHYCHDETFRQELQLVRHACCRFTADDEQARHGQAHCIIQSTVEEKVEVEAGSVVEYSHLGAGVHVERDCVVSCCQLPAAATVPAGTFIHTIFIGSGQALAAFVGVHEDVKKSVKPEAAGAELTLMGVPLKTALSRLSLTVEDLWPGQSKCSLWTARLHPVADSAEAAAQISLAAIHAVHGTKPLDTPLGTHRRLSFEEMLGDKNLEALLHHMQSVGRR